MKKAAFVLGYAGGILALIFSLFMIYTVPAKLITVTAEEIQNTMDNKDFLAFNEMVLAAQNGKRIEAFSEDAFKAFAEDVAKNSKVLQTKRVYDETAEYLYSHALSAVISIVLVGVAIIFALVAFIGSLALRKSYKGGAITMFIGAFVYLLASIYTETILPSVAATVFITLGGIFALMPETRKALKDTAERQRQFEPGYPQYGTPYNPAAQYPPQQIQFSYPKQQAQQPLVKPQYPAGGAPSSIEVPFPEEEARSLPQPNGEQNIKE